MRPDFVNYYAFDGELAQHLLERTHTDAISAIERLFATSLLEYIRAKINDYWDENTRSVTAKDEKGHTRRLNTVMHLGQKVQQLEGAKSKLDEKRIKIEAELEQKHKQYDQEVATLQGHSNLVEQVKVKLTECEDTVKMWTKDVLNAMADQHALSNKFASDIHKFKHLKQPVPEIEDLKLAPLAAREREYACLQLLFSL